MSSQDEARAAFNIKVLRRHDPAITSIIYSTSFVVLYDYVDGAWAKSGIEGPMFLYHRQSESPHYGFFVLNRNGVDNFSTAVTKGDDLETTGDFVIFRTAADRGAEGNEDDSDSGEEDDIIGIWVFEKDQRRVVGEQIARIQRLAEQEDEEESTVSDNMSTSKSVGPAHITSAKSAADDASTSVSLDELFASAPRSQIKQPSQPLQQQAHPEPIHGADSRRQPPLLDAIFQSARSPSPAQSPVPAHPHPPLPPSSGHVAHSQSPKPSVAAKSDVDAASAGLMAMLGLEVAAPTSAVKTVSTATAQPRNTSSSAASDPSAVAPGSQTLFNSAAGIPSPNGHSERHEADGHFTSPPTAASSRPRTRKEEGSNRSATLAEKGTRSLASKVASSDASASAIVNEQLTSESESSARLEPGLSKNDFIRQILSLIHTDRAFAQRLYDSYLARTTSTS